MEYYSALKSKETLTQAKSWMKPEDIMPSEISPTQKDKYCGIPLIGTTWSSQTHNTKSRMAVAGGGGKENGKLLSAEFQYDEAF